MMEFHYTEDITPYESLLSKEIIALRCKHVMNRSSEWAKCLYERSLAYGYPGVVWGHGWGISENEEENRIIQLHTIRRMIHKQVTRPFRLVIDDGGVLWVDNLHSAIRDVLVYGLDVRLSEVSCYLVDLSHGVPVVVNRGNTLSRNLDDILGAVLCSQKRNFRTNPEIREVHYSIGEFLAENEITRAAIGLPESDYEAYIDAAHDVYEQKGGVD